MTSFTFTLVKLTLTSGTIWTKATHLNSDSEFEVYTTDSTAAVRGTIFVVTTNGITTDTLVIEGEVDILRNTDIGIIKKLKDGESIQTDDSREKGVSKIDPNTIPLFLINTSIRDEETERNIALNEDEAEISEISPTCTPSEISDSITGIRTIITCDASGNPTEVNSCIDNAKELNADETECMNINCVDLDGEEVCEEVDGLNLFAYAPYQTAGHLQMYGENGIIKKADGSDIFDQAQITNNTYNLTSYCDNITSYSSPNNTFSFCRSGLTEGIFIDSSGNDEFLKYSSLNLDSDFIIEMNVQILLDDGQKHYLIHSGYNTANTSDDIGLYIKNGKLYFHTGEHVELTTGTFKTIILKREGGKIFAGEKDGTYFYKTFSSSINVNEILVGSFYRSSPYNDYSYQINSIIDYVKIYK